MAGSWRFRSPELDPDGPTRPRRAEALPSFLHGVGFIRQGIEGSLDFANIAEATR